MDQLKAVHPRSIPATSQCYHTTGQHGYVQNAYAVLVDTSDDEDGIDDDIATVTTHHPQYTHQYTQQPGNAGIPPFMNGPGQTRNTRNMTPAFTNIVKKYNNWNYCFSCGFDVKDGHTLQTCWYANRRPNHQEGANRGNAQQYIDAGYDACTKAKHKSVLPTAGL